MQVVNSVSSKKKKKKRNFSETTEILHPYAQQFSTEAAI